MLLLSTRSTVLSLQQVGEDTDRLNLYGITKWKKTWDIVTGYNYFVGNTVVGRALSKLKNDTETGTRNYRSGYYELHQSVTKFLTVRMMLFPNTVANTKIWIDSKVDCDKFRVPWNLYPAGSIPPRVPTRPTLTAWY